MKTVFDLELLGKSLDQCLQEAKSDPPEKRYDTVFSLACRVLDSEFSDYPDQVLERYLQGYLIQLSRELNIPDQ